jgi:hypothetical protein
MSRRLAVILFAAAALVALPAAPASADLGLRADFGSEGTGNGQFRWASGVGVDGGDRIFVADCYNDRIEIFNPDLTFNGQLGGPPGGGPAPRGSGPGQFSCPFDIATQGNDYIYVADLNNLRVQRFAGLDGNVPLDYIQSFVLRGRDQQPCAPYGVAVDPSGDVWISGGPTRDECQVVGKFSRSGAQVLTFGSRGDGPGQFYGYMHVAADPGGNVYVSDFANGRVQKFDTNGTFLSSFGHNGTGEGDFYGPHGLAVDPAGNVWVAETGINHRVQQFTPGNAFAARFAVGGPGPSGHEDYPYDVVADSHCNVYVTSTTGIFDGTEHVLKFGQSEAPFCRAATASTPATGGSGGPGTGIGGPVEAPTPPDRAAPTVTVSATAASFSARRGFVLPVRCNEPCTLLASAKVAVPGGPARVYTLSARRAKGNKGATARLMLKGLTKTNKAIAASLARGHKLKARVVITATDKATNVTTRRATVKLSR